MTSDALPAPTKRYYRIGSRLERVLALMAKGATRAEACAEAGISVRAVQMAVNKPHVRARLQEMALGTLRLSAPAAAATMASMLASDNAMARFRAASFVLSTGANIAPPAGPSLVINNNLGDAACGYIIDLSRPEDAGASARDVSPPRVINHEPSEPSGDNRDV